LERERERKWPIFLPQRRKKGINLKKAAKGTGVLENHFVTLTGNEKKYPILPSEKPKWGEKKGGLIVKPYPLEKGFSGKEINMFNKEKCPTLKKKKPHGGREKTEGAFFSRV